MWRIIFLLMLFCSISLNVYLFNQLDQQAPEPIIAPTPAKETISKVSGPAVSSSNQNGSWQQAAKKNNADADADAIKLSNKIKLAIGEGNYFLASALLNGLEQNNGAKLAAVKTFWFKDAEQLINNKNYLSAENSIAAFLEYSADDLAFLYLNVDLYLNKQQIIPAITLAHDIQFHAIDSGQERQSIGFTRNLIRQEITRLSESKLWFELSEFALQVSDLDPENFYIFFALSYAQYEQGEFEVALNNLVPLFDEPNFKLKAKKLSDKIQLALRKPGMIPLTKQGEHFIVHGRINDEFEVSLLLDTGASISLISQAVFDEIAAVTEIEYIKDITLNTAGGPIISSIYKVAEFELQGYRVENFMFAVSPYVSEGSDGLLGMNFLASFDFHIDQTNNLLRLESK